MRNIVAGKQNIVRRRVSDSRGMTMGEMLVVVAIICILFGVGFISVINHQRTLAQTERDGIAKEIFVAAQNHLTMAKGEGYLGEDKFGYAESGNDRVYYYVVNDG